MLKIHNLTPDHYHISHKISDDKATLISDFSWKLGVAFSFDEESNLCEVELPFSSSVNKSADILYDIDWRYFKKHPNKKLILTHRIIYHLPTYADTLNNIIKKHGLIDRVYWLTLNPLDFKSKNNQFKLLFLNPITNIVCDTGLSYLKDIRLNISNSKDWSNSSMDNVSIAQKNFSNTTKYFMSASRRANSHRLLSTYLIKNNISDDKGVITYHGIGDDNTSANHDDYLLEGSKIFSNLNIDLEELLNFKEFRGEVFDDVTRLHFANFRDTFTDKLGTCLVSYTQESVSNENDIFVTEKTWINYCIGRPFIMNGSRGHIQYLNRYFGFKSFDSIFDESYDMMDNYVDRVYYGVEELIKFCNLPFEEAKAKVTSIQNILDHNKKVFEALDHKDYFLRIFNEI